MFLLFMGGGCGPQTPPATFGRGQVLGALHVLGVGTYAFLKLITHLDYILPQVLVLSALATFIKN